MVLIQTKATNRKKNEEEEGPGEEIDLHDFSDEQRDQDRVENLEDTPVQIAMTEILDAKRIYGFCREIKSSQDRNTSRFVELEDGVLRRISLHDEENLQIVLPYVIRPRLFNLTHCKTVGKPGQKRMYSRIRKASTGQIWRWM